MEKKIAEVDLNAYAYSPQQNRNSSFRSEWATLSLVETSRTYNNAGYGIGPFGAASPDWVIIGFV